MEMKKPKFNKTGTLKYFQERFAPQFANEQEEVKIMSMLSTVIRLRDAQWVEMLDIDHTEEMRFLLSE